VRFTGRSHPFTEHLSGSSTSAFRLNSSAMLLPGWREWPVADK
jgi:hypothetical protein